MARPDPKDVARCLAYEALLVETPKSPSPFQQHERNLAAHYIKYELPDHARYHMCGAGVPKEYIVAVDALIGHRSQPF